MDWHTQAPKIASHIVASAHPVDGDGNVSRVRQFNFTSAMPFSHMKERLDFLDADKSECKSTLHAGGGRWHRRGDRDGDVAHQGGAGGQRRERGEGRDSRGLGVDHRRLQAVEAYVPRRQP
ncbi:hypothetical protein ABZP36_005187 [Zizania latifolia]